MYKRPAVGMADSPGAFYRPEAGVTSSVGRWTDSPCPIFGALARAVFPPSGPLLKAGAGAEEWQVGARQPAPHKKGFNSNANGLSSDRNDKLSDRYMSSQRISIRIGSTLERKLRLHAALTGKYESAIAREALEKYLSEPTTGATAYDLALGLGLIGAMKGAPRDLSANPEHFRGFGKH